MYWTFIRKSFIIPIRSRCSKKQRLAESTKGQKLAERRVFSRKNLRLYLLELRGAMFPFLVTAFKTRKRTPMNRGSHRHRVTRILTILWAAKR